MQARTVFQTQKRHLIRWRVTLFYPALVQVSWFNHTESVTFTQPFLHLGSVVGLKLKI